MQTDMQGKVALVTGAGKKTGIGYAIAGKLAEHGCDLIIADYGKDQDPSSDVPLGTMAEMTRIGVELSGAFGVTTLVQSVDVTQTQTIDTMVTRIRDTFDHVDILVNNAGATFGVPNGVHTYDETAWVKTVDVNLHGVFRMSRAVVPLMPKTGGAIVNIASRAGKEPPLFNGAYAVAKAGVIMLTKVMARELAGMGIRVNAICPGQIMTDLERWRFGLEAQLLNSTVEEREKTMCETIPLGRIGSPEEVADMALFLSSGASAYVTGQAMNICGGQLMTL